MARLVVAGTDAEARRLALAVQASAAATLQGCVGPTVGDAEELAAELAVAPANPTRLPRRTQGVIVSAQATARVEWAATWLTSGLSVLIGSPVAATLDEVNELATVASRHRSLVGVAEPVLFAPPVVESLRHVGTLGELDHVEVHAHVVGDEPDEAGLDASFRRAGAAALALVASLGDATTIELDVEDQQVDRWVATVRRHGRAIGSVSMTGGAGRDVLWAQAAGLAHSLHVEVWPDPSVELDGNEMLTPHGLDPDDPTDQLRLSGYRAMVDGFAGAIDGRGGAVCPLGFGRRVLELSGA